MTSRSSWASNSRPTTEATSAIDLADGGKRSSRAIREAWIVWGIETGVVGVRAGHLGKWPGSAPPRTAGRRRSDRRRWSTSRSVGLSAHDTGHQHGDLFAVEPPKRDGA